MFDFPPDQPRPQGPDGYSAEKEDLAPSIRSVVLSAGNDLLSQRPAEGKAHTDVEFGVNERVKGGIAGVRRHARLGRGICREQVRHHFDVGASCVPTYELSVFVQE